MFAVKRMGYFSMLKEGDMDVLWLSKKRGRDIFDFWNWGLGGLLWEQKIPAQVSCKFYSPEESVCFLNFGQKIVTKLYTLFKENQVECSMSESMQIQVFHFLWGNWPYSAILGEKVNDFDMWSSILNFPQNSHLLCIKNGHPTPTLHYHHQTATFFIP